MTFSTRAQLAVGLSRQESSSRTAAASGAAGTTQAHRNKSVQTINLFACAAPPPVWTASQQQSPERKLLASTRRCCVRDGVCTRGLRRAALEFTALSGLRLGSRVAAVAPGYQLLPLVALHLSNLDTGPTGLAALEVATTRELYEQLQAQNWSFPPGVPLIQDANVHPKLQTHCEAAVN